MKLETRAETPRPLSRPQPQPRERIRLEVRTPGGHRAWTVGPDGLAPALAESTGRPDVVLVGEEVALAAVLGGFLTPLSAAREGQLKVLGEHETLVRLGQLLSGALVA